LPEEGGIYDQDPFVMEGMILVTQYYAIKQEFEEKKKRNRKN